ncbi:MAG: LysR family transcriptional regulator [Jatrophihabitans sp.]|uniref:LysR family transcriptional regulator n=1 Tax=Jatrophihabitans sp. TaxID=1932789 RepID=UPI003F7F082D
MELRHLRAYVAVAEERHFGRAAERLHIAQPPLSQMIRALEGELGVTLLERTTRRVELTTAGTAYLERARSILHTVDDAADEARLVASGSIGRLTLGCVGSVTYSLLPRVARALSELSPGLEISFRGEMLVPDQVAALHAGEIDLALLRTPLSDPDLVVRVLRRDALVAAVPTGHRLAGRRRLEVRDLRDTDLIMHAGRGGSVMFGRVAALCQDAGFTPRVRHEVVETSTLVTLVAAGLGIAVVPEPVTALALAGVRYLPLRGAGRVELAVARARSRTEPHVLQAAAAIVSLAQGPDVMQDLRVPERHLQQPISGRPRRPTVSSRA